LRERGRNLCLEKKDQLFSTGERNKLIDSIFHPLAKNNLFFWIVDGGFHAAVEQDHVMTVKKFIRYNGPRILKQFLKEQSNRKRKRL